MIELVERVRSLSRGGRVVLGIAGVPGVGKTTLAEHLVAALESDGLVAAHVPMDGFHLADAALDRLGRRDRKGAIDTFDADGYLALLRRIRTETGPIYAPAFDRSIEQPIAGSILIDSDAQIVVSEGNYLLSQITPWPDVRATFDEVWFADIEHSVRLERLYARHVRFGKTPEQATAWIDAVDEPNARAILADRDRADLIVDVAAAVPAR